MRIVLYSLPASVCQACKATKRALEKAPAVPYEEIPLHSTPGAMDFVKSLGYTSAPVVVADFGDGASTSWSGFRPTMIDELKSTLGRCP